MKAWSYISGWANFALPSNIQKRLYKFVLRKAIGQFLQNELDLEHFDIALLNGSVELRDLDLNLLFINKLLLDTPFILEKGRVSSISVSIPWAKLLSGDISIKIQGLHLTLRPIKDKPRETRDDVNGAASEEHLMSSSLHFADDFLRTEIEKEQARELHKSIQESLMDSGGGEQQDTDMDTEGLQVLTSVIDKMMSRVKVDVIDTLIRISHKSSVRLVEPSNTRCHHPNSFSKQEYSLDLCIPRVSYFDETTEFNDVQQNQSQNISPLMESSILTNEIIKIITIASPEVWLRSSIPSGTQDVIPTVNETDSNDTLKDDNSESIAGQVESNVNILEQTEFFEAEEGTSSLFLTSNQVGDSFNSSHLSGSITPKALDEEAVNKPYEALLLTTMDEKNWIRMKLRPSIDAISFMSIKQIDIITARVRAIIAPQQLAFFLDLLDTIMAFEPSNSPSTKPCPAPVNKRATPGKPTNISNNIDTLLRDLDSVPITAPATSTDTHQEFIPEYSEIPSTFNQSTPSSAPFTATKPAYCKIKLQMTLLELFILAEDNNVKNWSEPGKEASHIRFAIQQLNARVQQFSDTSTAQSGRQRTNHSNQQHSQQQQNVHGNSPMSVADIRIANVCLDEWIKRPPQARPLRRENAARAQTQYERYNPILELDNRIKYDYDGNVHFAEYEPTKAFHQKPMNQSSYMPDNGLRIRIERKRTRNMDHFDDTHIFEEDVNVDIPAFKLLLDPRVVDRFDAYIHACILRTNDANGREKPSSGSQQPMGAHKASATQTCEAAGPSVFPDLQIEENIRKRKVKVKFAFIRVILFIPDMSQASTREAFNDSFHVSQLSIDLKKITGTYATTTTINDDNDLLGLENHNQQLKINEGLPSSKKPNKINLELDFINVFMHLKDDQSTRCWFTAKTVQDNEQVFSQGSISPTIEVLLQSPVTNTTMDAPSFDSPRTGIFGSGSDIPETLFNYLNRNESFTEEQKLHLPMDEQCESAMIFNQRTIETSLFVLNCHFPQADMNLTKEVWDKVQLVQNDILLWQPRFLLHQQKQQQQQQQTQHRHNYDQQQEEVQDDGCSTAPSINYHHFLSEIRSTASYFPESTPSVRSSVYTQQYDQQPQYLSTTNQRQPVRHTLLSVVAVIGNGAWKLYTSAKHAYLFEFCEFRYFAAIKHMNESENITTLDIEDFVVRDVSDPERQGGILLLYKALPKYIHPKRNTAMVSLLSRLNNFPESNTIKKMTSVVVSNICLKATMNVDFINELVEFQKAPEELVFIDPPTQYIKVFAHVLDVSIDYEPLYSPTRAVVVLDGIEIITNILAGQPTIEVKVFSQNNELLMIDDKRDLNPQRVSEQLTGKISDARKYWCTLGFIHTLAIQNIELCVKIKLDEHVRSPQIDVALISTDICINTSADSFQTLLNLITFMSNNGDETIPAAILAARAATNSRENTKTKQHTQTKNKKKEEARIYKVNAASNKENMLASIDESAFRSIPTKISPPTFIDLPEMEEFSFIEQFYDSSTNNTPAAPIKPPIKPRRRMHKRQQAQRRKKASEDNVRMLIPEEDLIAGMVEGADHAQQDTHQLSSFFLIEDYFGAEKKVAPVSTDTIVDLAEAKLSLRVSNVNVVWKLYDGYDWDYVKLDIAAREKLKKQEEHKQQIPKLASSAAKSMWEQQTGFQDTYTATSKSDRDKSRTTEASMEIKLSNVSAVYDVMPENADTASYFHLRIKDVDVLDNIVTSDWKKFLGYMRSRTQQREVDQSMVDIELTSLRPVKGDPQQEFRLKAKLLPIRMYVDQDALVFLQRFFLFEKEFLRSTSAANQSIVDKEEDGSEEDSEQSPVSSVEDGETAATSIKSKPGAFFQHVDIYPITIKVDYKPKVFKFGSLKEGQVIELMNLFRLDGSELSLSHVKLTGIKGVDQLTERLGQEWLPHILSTQKLKMVSGVSPVRSLFNLGTGMADLVLLPIQQYRKDGRLLKGIQRGTSSFAKATAIEAIKLGSRVASGTQVVLEHADGFFSSSSDETGELSTTQLRQLVQEQPFVYTDLNGVEISSNDETIYPSAAPSTSTDAWQASTPSNVHNSKSKNRRSHSSDLSEGLQSAYHSISKNLESAAQTIFAVPTNTSTTDTAANMEGCGRRDSTSSDQFNFVDDIDYNDRQQEHNVYHKNKKNAKIVIRAVPVAVIKPMIGLTSAFQSILSGIRSSIDPVMRLQSEDKYKKAP